MRQMLAHTWAQANPPARTFTQTLAHTWAHLTLSAHSTTLAHTWAEPGSGQGRPFPPKSVVRSFTGTAGNVVSPVVVTRSLRTCTTSCFGQNTERTPAKT